MFIIIKETRSLQNPVADPSLLCPSEEEKVVALVKLPAHTLALTHTHTHMHAHTRSLTSVAGTGKTACLIKVHCRKVVVSGEIQRTVEKKCTLTHTPAHTQTHTHAHP